MKNLQSILVVIITALTVVACGGSGSSDGKSWKASQLVIPYERFTDHPVDKQTRMTDEQGNLFYVWVGENQRLYSARNTVSGWEEIHELTEGKLPVLSHQWLVTPSGDLYVSWIEGMKKSNIMSLKLIHYSQEKDAVTPEIEIASFDSMKALYNKNLRELKDTRLRLDSNGDLIITWFQSSTDTPFTKYFYEFVNQRYVADSGLQGSPVVFYPEGSQYSYLKDIESSPNNTFIVLGKTNKGLTFLACAEHLCSPDSIVSKSVESQSLTTFRSIGGEGLVANAQDQATWVALYEPDSGYAIAYSPENGWSETNEVNEVRHLSWLDSNDDVVHTRLLQKDMSWSDKTLLRTSKVPGTFNSTLIAKNPQNITYMSYPSKVIPHDLGGFHLYTYSDEKGWNKYADITKPIAGFLETHHLAFDNYSNPIVVWLGMESRPSQNTPGDNERVFVLTVSRISN